MDEDAMMALGSVLAAIGGILERNNVCTVTELAETVGAVAIDTKNSGPQYERRAGYIGSFAWMLRAAAKGGKELKTAPRH
jgi:hypothetical protein